MPHILNHPQGLYYNGELIGIITNPDPFGDSYEICEALSPDEGLAQLLPLPPGRRLDLLAAISELPETIDVDYDEDEE